MRPSPTLSFCATLICSAIAFSCAHTLESGQEQQPRVLPAAALPDSISFTAYLDAGSKTHFGEEWNVLWSPGDRIKVFNESHPQGLEFTLIGDGGSSVGTFSGPLTGDGPFYVVYPADAAGEMSGTSIAVTLPAIQTYAAGSFGLGANLAAGHAEALEGICFHNLTGVLSLTLTGEKAIREIKVSAYDEQPLLGTGSIDGWEAESTPVLTLDAGQTAEDFREIILDCGESGVPLDVTTGTAFFLNVPAETLAGGYRIEVCDTEGKAMVKYAKAQTENQVDRSEIVQMPTLAYSPAYKAAFLQSGTIGAFRNASSPGSGMTPLCEYAEGKSQYAYRNTTDSRYLRLEDWEEEYALAFTMPANLPAGKKVQVSLQSLGNLPIDTGTREMKVVKQSRGKVWMLDSETGTGYILMMVEE